MTRVCDGLYWCGRHEVRDFSVFDVVVDTIGVCTDQPKLPQYGPTQIVVAWTFPDTAALPDLCKLHVLAAYLRDCISRGLTVLVFCAAGWNRSGLIVAEILRGRGRLNLVGFLQSLRPGALNNQTFREYVLSIEERA